MIANGIVHRPPRPLVDTGRLLRILAVWIGIFLLSLLAIGGGPRSAEAGLGGSANSVVNDAQKLGAMTSSGSASALQSAAVSPEAGVQTFVLRTSTGTKYTYSEFTTANNQRVREFIRPDGKVFGLAWQGPRPPDLQVLLGSYFGTWQDAIANGPHQSLHRSQISTPSLVVEMAGPMGFVVGHAWAPALVPAGVDARNVVQ
jgi:Protein of unknown function (DUF2844)